MSAPAVPVRAPGVPGQPAREGARTATSADPAPAGLRQWRRLHVASLVVAAAVLVVANRGQWFFKDDFEFLTRRTGQPNGGSIWEPHNAHWSTLPALAYKALYAGFQLTTYWPWIALLIAVHLTAVHLAWRLCLHAQAGPAASTVTAAVLGVLGSGAENLLWGFQIGFDGVVALVLGMTLVLDRPRLTPARGVAAVAMAVAAVMSSGVSLPLLVLPGVVCLVRHRVLRTAAVFAVPAAAYLSWYLLAGGSSTQAPRPSATQYLAYVAAGLRDAVADSTGSRLAPALAAVALVGVAVLARRDPSTLRLPAVVVLVGSALTVLALYASIGVGRATLGVAQAGESRYVYVAAMTGAPLAAAVGGVLVRWRPRATTVPLAAVALFVLLHNTSALQERAAMEQARETTTREGVAATLRLIRDGEPVLNLPADPNSGYSGANAIAALDRRGDFGTTLREVSPAVLATQRLRVQFQAVRVRRVAGPVTAASEFPTPETATPAGPVARSLAFRPAPGSSGRPAGRCTAVSLDGGGRPQVLLATAGGPGSVTVTAGHSGTAAVEFLPRPGETVAAATTPVTLYRDVPTTLTWVAPVGTLRVSFPGGAATTVCRPGESPAR